MATGHATGKGVCVGVEVRVAHLSKSFGRQNIWHDVSFTLPAGEIGALLGPSGTGKSVFLKCLIGLLRPEGGAPGEALIAEIVDPMGPDEEYVPLPLARQQTLLEHLNREGFETD